MTGAQEVFDFALWLDGAGGVAPDGSEPQAAVRWLDLDIHEEPARGWIRNDAGLDPVVAAALCAVETRPRSLMRPDGMLVVLRGVNLNPGADPEDMVALRMWVEPGRIITAHRRRLLSVGDVRDELLAGEGPTSAGEVLDALVEKLANRIGTVVGEIEQRVDALELRAAEAEVKPLRAELTDLRREMADLRRYLSPQRDALDRVCRQPPAFMHEVEVQRLREEADRITRYLEDLDLAREQAMVTHEELVGRMAEEQNARMYLLSVVAAIFLPLSFLTGVFGMNVAGLPGTENPLGFAWTAFGMGSIGVALVVYFRHKRWI